MKLDVRLFVLCHAWSVPRTDVFDTFPISAAGYKMEGQRLIHAVRHHDVAAVNEQLKGETTVDVNIEVEVEGSAFLPQEDPVFRSTPLVEGVRSRCPEVIHALLAIDGVDVNKRTVG